jgi:hypothetical protein
MAVRVDSIKSQVESAPDFSNCNSNVMDYFQTLLSILTCAATPRARARTPPTPLPSRPTCRAPRRTRCVTATATRSWSTRCARLGLRGGYRSPRQRDAKYIKKRGSKMWTMTLTWQAFSAIQALVRGRAVRHDDARVEARAALARRRPVGPGRSALWLRCGRRRAVLRWGGAS